MIKLESTKKLYPLWTMLIGLISFLISGIIVSLIPLGFLIQFIFVGPVGSLIMLFMLGMLDKKKLVNIVLLSALGTFMALFVGFGIGEVISLLFPSLENIVGTIIMNIIFGAIFAVFFYGRKSIGFFASVCGIVSILFGLLLVLTNDCILAGFNLNFLVITTSLGTTTGLGIGLYNLFKLKNKD